MADPPRRARKTADDIVLYASDLDGFLYCERSWWYRMQGEDSSRTADLARGTEQHEALARNVRLAVQLAPGTANLAFDDPRLAGVSTTLIASSQHALMAAARAWRDEDPDPATRAEVDRLLVPPGGVSPDVAGLAERFGARLLPCSTDQDVTALLREHFAANGRGKR